MYFHVVIPVGDDEIEVIGPFFALRASPRQAEDRGWEEGKLISWEGERVRSSEKLVASYQVSAFRIPVIPHFK
jgi:hypothetical protein